MHTQMGTPLAKVTDLLGTRFDLPVTPGGLAHLLHRTARDAAPTYAALCRQVRETDVVTPDETRWRVGAVRHWLGIRHAGDDRLRDSSRPRGPPLRRGGAAHAAPTPRDSASPMMDRP